MHNGNPKLYCENKICYSCKQTTENVVDSYPRIPIYICQNCRVTDEEKVKIAENTLAQKQKTFEENRDYIAKDLGWYKNDDNTYCYLFLKSRIAEHPIKPEKNYIKSLLPQNWRLSEDDLYYMCEFVGSENRFFLDRIIISNSSHGDQDNSLYDICQMVTNVRKYVNNIKDMNGK